VHKQFSVERPCRNLQWWPDCDSESDCGCWMLLLLLLLARYQAHNEQTMRVHCPQLSSVNNVLFKN